MRLLILAVSLSALCGASYWALTGGPFAPGGGGVEGLVTELTTAAEAAVAGDDARPDFDGGQVVFTRLDRQVYPLEGTSAEALLQSMLERGPRSGESIFFGLTDTQLDVHYDPIEVAGGCMIRNARVYVDVRITLPAWDPPPGADPDLIADWRHFAASLAAHEDRHREIAVGGAERSYLAVAELFRPTCEEAVEEARRRLESIGVEVSAVHRRFDTETAHGKTEGAVWPPVR